MATRMSPPRKPRGEKPATTIRFLRRQIANMQAELGICRQALSDRDSAIAQQQVFLGEAEERERILSTELENNADAYGILLATTQTQRLRLAYLEGYHAKSTETLPGAGPGNPGPYSYGEADSEAEGQENLAERLARAGRREVRSFAEDHSAHHHWRPSREDPIIGPAHDATAAELARHRR